MVDLLMYILYPDNAKCKTPAKKQLPPEKGAFCFENISFKIHVDLDQKMFDTTKVLNV